MHFNCTKVSFINYGPLEGDDLLPPGNDQSFLVSLNFGLPFHGRVFNSCYISINGHISFDSNLSSRYFCARDYTHAISPLCYDLYTLKGGNIYYKQIANLTTLNQIGDEINSLLSLNKTFSPNNAFVVTYDTVRASPGNSNKNVSFQIILSTDGIQSYATLNYGNLDFQPSESAIQYNLLGYFNKYFFTNVKLSSNVNLPGKWIFNLLAYGKYE